MMEIEIRKNLEELARLEVISDQAEADYEREPDNAEYEAAFDEAYQKEFNIYLLVSSQIAVFSGISDATARKMVKTKRKELVSLFL